MTLKFCQRCKSLMSPHKINGENFLKCLNCDLIQETSDSFLKTSEKIDGKKELGGGIRKDENLFATYKNTCKKCGYDLAQILDMGIFYSDEDNLILLKCGSCGFSEKIGRKTS